ncbi:MAG: hypothetical protein L0H42_12070 [Yaniella sp.]|nr:hypothetical protein [Yaniella sp.]MDN5819034.1 hypothetical protein [Yaniella sp.]
MDVVLSVISLSVIIGLIVGVGKLREALRSRAAEDRAKRMGFHDDD